jgi:hypothetical protein
MLANRNPMFSWLSRTGRTVLACVGCFAFAGAGAAQNLVQNPGFESGINGWFGWGSVTVTASTAQFRTGAQAALVANRDNTWNGIAQSLVGVLQPTNTYRISAWIRLVSGSNQPVLLTMHKVDGGGTSYQTIASGIGQSASWVQLTGGYTHVVSGTLSNLNFYIEGPAAGGGFFR